MKAALPENHPDIARSLCSLASLYKVTKCFDQAQECFAKALRIMRRALPKDHVDTARVLNNLALLYVQALIPALARMIPTQTLPVAADFICTCNRFRGPLSVRFAAL